MAKHTDAITFSDKCNQEALGECIFNSVTAEIHGQPWTEKQSMDCLKAAGCSCPALDDPTKVIPEVEKAYGDAWENSMKISEEGWNMFFGKLNEAAENYRENKMKEGAIYVKHAAAIAKQLKCNAAATDACARDFANDPMGFEMCMNLVPGCMDGLVSVDWSSLPAKHAAVQKVHGSVNALSASQWTDLAAVYAY